MIFLKPRVTPSLSQFLNFSLITLLFLYGLWPNFFFFFFFFFFFVYLSKFKLKLDNYYYLEYSDY